MSGISNGGILGAVLALLGGTSGAAQIGVSAYEGGPKLTVEKVARMGVHVAKYLDTDNPTAAQATAAIQAAVNSGAKCVKISRDYTINAGIELKPNVTIEFDGGTLTATADGAFPNGVLFATARAGIRIYNPVIDASATAGVRAISLIDCWGAQVRNVDLKKAIIGIEGTSNATRVGCKVSGGIIDLTGWAQPCIYVSAAKGVHLADLELTGGKEGVGIYNGSSAVKHVNIDSYGQLQDGFVIIGGVQISYSNCQAHDNGQSGFTTQRMNSGQDTRRVTWSACLAWQNAYDGFDLRGANDAQGAWGVEMMLTLTGCQSYKNGGTGYYLILAEGVTLVGCTADCNAQQNFFVNKSTRARLVGCLSSSGASGVPTAVANGGVKTRAGICFQDSNDGMVVGCTSTNADGATQEYGITFVGTSTGNTVLGGHYENNSIGTFDLGTGGSNRILGASAELMAGSGVFLKSVSRSGVYDEEGFGVPTHARAKGSTFMRLESALPEFYISTGGGAWVKH